MSSEPKTVPCPRCIKVRGWDPLYTYTLVICSQCRGKGEIPNPDLPLVNTPMQGLLADLLNKMRGNGNVE